MSSDVHDRVLFEEMERAQVTLTEGFNLPAGGYTIDTLARWAVAKGAGTHGLSDRIKAIKERTPMYFGRNPTVECLYNFLLGWDSARGTSVCRKFIERLAKLKRTYAAVPDNSHIDFNEAISELEDLVRLIEAAEEPNRLPDINV